jgi:hypothetical protein
MMTSFLTRAQAPTNVPSGAVPYSPEILPLMQSLLQALADIDVMHEKEREGVQTSALNARQKEEALG